MSAKKAILTIHPMIRNTLLLIPFITIFILYFLQEGISVDSLKIGNFKIQGLYLKLDKKLILKVDELHIPKEHSDSSLASIEDAVRKVKQVLSYFEYIELKNIVYTNEKYHIMYADEIIYINSNAYEIVAEIILQKGGMVASVPMVYIKKYDLRLSGEMTYAYDSEKITFDGIYTLLNINGSIKAEMRDDKVTAFLDSKEASSISKALDMFEIPKEVRVWIDKNIRADRYKILFFRGEGKISDDGFILDMNRTEAKVELSNVKIKFNSKLKSIKSKKVTIRLHEGRLDFDLKRPLYMKKDMSGSKAALLNLTGNGYTKLLLKMKFNCRYDSEIREILKSYKVEIPLKQKSGTMKAEIDLDIDLEPKNVKVEGRVLLSNGEIDIGGAKLKVKGGEVTFVSNQIALWDVDIHDSWYRGLVSGSIDLDRQKAKFEVDLKRLKLGDKKSTSIVINNKNKLAVNMDFSDTIKFDIPAYKLSIKSLKKGGIRIDNSNIKPLLPYIKNLPLRLESGRFSMTTKDYISYDFSGNAKWERSYIYNKEGYLSKISFKGRYIGDKLTISAFGGKFFYNSSKSLIKIKNINIDAKKMINLYRSKTGNGLQKLNVEGLNSIIRYGKHILLTDTFNLVISGKNTTFSAFKDGDLVRVEKNGNSLVVHANQIKDKMLGALINFGGLKGGRYSLELLGNINGEMKGVIDIKGGAIKSFKAYNNLIALFNTIPALMSLSNPGFSKKGFVVRDGKIEFRILSDRVLFDNIYINGKSSTIAGKGSIELDSGKLNIDLAVRTAREIGKVLGSLPLVGYILFGKDKSMTTGVKIVGTMQKPDVKTSPVQEALLYPLELIKRTITSPVHINN